MAFSDDVFPLDDCCEVCGAALEDEIVIQEFADGSLARLCPECAAGAALGGDRLTADDFHADDKPLQTTLTSGAPPDEPDPLDKTRELLMPVTDLISLQGEMQAALGRLAASLEQFASGMITETQDKTATVEGRLETLERELEKTRTRLRETEFLLTMATASTAATAPTPAPSPATAPTPAPSPAEVATSEAQYVPAGAEPVSVASAAPVPVASAPVASAPTEASSDAETPHGFRLEEVQAAQRLFNDGPFTGKTREVRRSLGKPRANLARAVGAEPRAFITIAWDIVWYQYLVDLRRDIPSDERVVLFREGMDLDELADHFKEKNALIDDDGRLDASELEVRLLSDPSALITEMTPDEERALEDATEEIWDQRLAPEFKWDD
jgi:hypothetical protein